MRANSGERDAEADSALGEPAAEPAPPEPAHPSTDLRLKTPPSGEASRAAPSLQPFADARSVPQPAGYVDYVGSTIDGRYNVESLIGEGGMGFVYRARHRVIDKVVAIKILRPEVARHHEVMDRFLIEAKAASAIGNAHIVDTLDFGTLPDGLTFYVMEYLDGRTLTRVLEAESPLAFERIADIGKQIAEALFAAHEAQIVHRDLKPENVFIIDRDRQPDFVKILDFGIAKVESFQNKLTQAGTVFGTPHYMSPEQASGGVVDHRSDIYSVGVILYELTAGRVPFDAEQPLGILSQHVNDEPVPPSTIAGPARAVPPGLDAIIMKCLAKDRAARYQSMAELFDELTRLETGFRPDALEEKNRRELLAKLSSELPPREVPSSPRRVLPWLFAGALALVAIASARAASRVEPVKGSVANVFAETAPGWPLYDEPSVAPARLAAADGKRQVALVLSPVDAHVFRGEQDLGPMPVSIPVGPGEQVSLEVRRSGYTTRRIVVSDAQPRVVVKLTSLAGAARQGTVSAPVQPSPATPPSPVAIDEPAAGTDPAVNREQPRTSDQKGDPQKPAPSEEKPSLPEAPAPQPPPAAPAEEMKKADQPAP